MPTHWVPGIWMKPISWWIACCWSPGVSCFGQLRRPKLVYYLKNFCEYIMNQLGSKLIFIPVMFPGQWCHHNCCLWCSWCALKTQTMQNFQSPVAKKCLPPVRELSFLRSPVKLGLSLDSASKTLHTHVEGQNRTVWGVFSPSHQLCWSSWLTKKISPCACHTKWNNTVKRPRRAFIALNQGNWRNGTEVNLRFGGSVTEAEWKQGAVKGERGL